MTTKSITATISTQALDRVKASLRGIGIPGISVSRIRGYGGYRNFFRRDWLVSYARVQVYAPSSKVDQIIQVIVEAAHTGSEDDGVIAVSSIESLFRICDKSDLIQHQH